MNKAILADKVQDIEQGMKPYMPEETGYQKTIFEAMNYSVSAGGKRLRPMFMYETYQMFGGDDEAAVRPFMMALEMIHTYSLVHDDLPAMDNDDYRRGKLTTHKKYGEDMGILAGDALLNGAYETAFLAFDSETSQAQIAKALRVLGAKAGVYGMVGGQVCDVENNGHFLDEEMLWFVHKNKTAALIECAFMTGAILAGATEEQVRIVEQAGTEIGLAFQIQDDILDVIGDQEKIGKPVHSDERNEKTTCVTLYGIERCGELVRQHTLRGLEKIRSLNVFNEEHREFLCELMQSLVEREM
ncbi:MAG: polyprenyl synthetase family protein [Eubacterium sp.]|nr:polyprenyl synthetase family protein [Eubacterium sp.]